MLPARFCEYCVEFEIPSLVLFFSVGVVQEETNAHARSVVQHISSNTDWNIHFLRRILDLLQFHVPCVRVRPTWVEVSPLRRALITFEHNAHRAAVSSSSLAG